MNTQHQHHVVPVRTYLIVYIVLLALLSATVTAWYFNLGLLGILLGDKTGFYEDVRLDAQGARTVLALRSKYAGRTLSDATRYIDPSYRDKALAK